MARQDKTKSEKETKIDRQIKKFLPFFVWILVLLAIFFVLYYVFQGIGKIEYNGMTFTKEKFGELIFYHYSYLIKAPSGKIVTRDIFLRGDPRENKVPVEGEIIYPAGKIVYITINSSGINQCEDNLIALSTLTNFLVSNNLEVKGGVPDKAEAEQNNYTYVACKDYDENAVIWIEGSNETRIKREGNYCYKIDIANCEILPALEKFIVQSIIDAKKSQKD